MNTKDRPILFSAPMVRGLLDGSKTQTRRTCNPQPINVSGGVPSRALPPSLIGVADPRHGIAYKCPYGKRGDRLWVRETYWIDDEDNAIIYRADKNADIVDTNRHETGSKKYNWKPSIFMPRAASRITLEITGVRVERLQDINEADLIQEGSPYRPCAYQNPAWTPRRLGYCNMWEQINGPDSWAANPWVWVIEFKKAGQ